MANKKAQLRVVTEEEYFNHPGNIGKMRISFRESLNPIYLFFEKKPSCQELSQFLKETLMIDVDNYTITWN